VPRSRPQAVPTRLHRNGSLLALCVGPGTAEAALITAFGAQTGLSLAPQANAPVPFGIFHDLRWLVVYSRSWEGLLAEGLALLVVRSLFTALTVRAAWPPGLDRPPLPSLLIRAAAFTVGGAALLSPWTILLFGLAVAPVSWFFLASVPAALIIALLFHHGAIAPGWWRQNLAPRALAWIALTFLALSASAEAIAAVPPPAGVAVVGVAGVFNAWAWRGLVCTVANRSRAAGFRPVAPAGLVGLASVVIAGTVAGFSLAARAPRPPIPSAIAARRAGTAGGDPAPGGPGWEPLLIASGYGTHWNGSMSPPPFPGPYTERRFSYSGLGPHGALPYTSIDTTKPLVTLERLMAVQVQALHHLTGKHVNIVADSEGALVAKAYLAASPHAPVSTLVMVSPLVRPARVYYPPTGLQGWGLAGGAGLLTLSRTIRSVAPIPLSPSTPFLRSVVREAPSLRPLLSCPLPGIRQFAFLPLADAVASPEPFSLGIPSVVFPAFHGTMLANPAAQRALRSVLSGKRLPPTPGWSLADRVIRSAASAWQVPGLALSLNPAWGQGTLPQGPPNPSRCQTIRAHLRAQLRGARPR
jgi:hypothetical protein